MKLRKGLLDLDLLLLEMPDLDLDLVEGELEVHGRLVARALLGHHGADLGEREAELLALQDHREAVTVAGVIDAGRSVAARGQEPAILVEPQGPESDPNSRARSPIV